MEKTPSIEKMRKRMSPDLEAKLNKIYAPSSRIDDHFRGNDLTFFTNDKGEAHSLYIGKRNEQGNIVGEYYIRKVKKRENNVIKESHWDNKGKVSGKIPKG